MGGGIQDVHLLTILQRRKWTPGGREAAQRWAGSQWKEQGLNCILQPRLRHEVCDRAALGPQGLGSTLATPVFSFPWNWKASAPVPVVEAHRLGRLQRGRSRRCPGGPGTCPLSRGPWRYWGLRLALGARRLSFPSRRGRTWQPGAGSLLCGGPHRSPVCGDRSPIHGGHWAGAGGEGTQASQKRSERARVQEKNQSLFLLRWEQGTLGGVGGRPVEAFVGGSLPGEGPGWVWEDPSTVAQGSGLSLAAPLVSHPAAAAAATPPCPSSPPLARAACAWWPCRARCSLSWPSGRAAALEGP